MNEKGSQLFFLIFLVFMTQIWNVALMMRDILNFTELQQDTPAKKEHEL